ncbi:MAG: hypothetical protein KJ630_13065 [Proteobacteria bacterium]|nr:hypothetical protein [Pseudomonadota bacterium]
MDDRADLDGDGKFDVLDISIMEDDRGARRPINNNGGCGCCIVLLFLGSTIGAGWYGVCQYLA